jgi:DNA-directed RNA polymerase subunit M/transcription elongation factor TFIIS
MAQAHKDERRARRYNVRNFELYCSEGGLFAKLFRSKSSEKLPVVNFSVGGAQFLSDKRFNEGKKLKIHLRVPTAPDPLPIDAQVCWCQQVPRRGAFRVGVQFAKASGQSEEALHQIEAKIGTLTIRVLCPKCKSALTVKKKYEGSQARCPKCKTPVKVWEPEKLPELDSEKKASTEEAAEKGEAKATYGHLRRPFVRFIKSTIPSRLHLDIVQHFAKSGRGQVAGSRDLATQLGVSEKKVRAALRELVNRGVIKEIGVKTFNYDPVPAARQHLAELATSLTSPGKRSEVLAVILESEKKGS